MILFSKVQYLEKKNGYGPIKNLGDRSKVVLALWFYLLLFPNGLQELEY